MEFAWRKLDDNEFQASIRLQKKDDISAFDVLRVFCKRDEFDLADLFGFGDILSF
jgi:hypothetical protein